MRSKIYGVITTILSPTRQVKRVARELASESGKLIVVGDRKTPVDYYIENTVFLPIDEQKQMEFALPRVLPENHYSRKNIGYLQAISDGAESIYETDDDNEPNSRWVRRAATLEARSIQSEPWCNVYRLFSKEFIWPRGFPLEQIREQIPLDALDKVEATAITAPIQQSLVDGSPDVDAIFRLLFDKPITFDQGESIALQPGTWCPFNSQNTWWWPLAYPLMYLPSYCSFRMTDIWRSFVAQRCLWELDLGIAFNSSDMVQERNPHNLLKDFSDEVPGYTNNTIITNELADIKLKRGSEAVIENLVTCYSALVKKGILPDEEMALVKIWAKDVSKAMGVDSA